MKKLFFVIITCLTLSLSLHAAKSEEDLSNEELAVTLEKLENAMKRLELEHPDSMPQANVAWVTRHFNNNQIEWSGDSEWFFDARIEMFVLVECLPFIRQLLDMGPLDEKGTTPLSLAKEMNGTGWIKALEMLRLKEAVKELKKYCNEVNVCEDDEVNENEEEES